MKTPDRFYLYADGHAVCVYRETITRRGQVAAFEWAEVFEKWTRARCDFEGRLSFSPYSVRFFMDTARRAVVIRAKSPSLDHGSENTRKHGFPVGYLTFDLPGESNCLQLIELPGLISAQWSYCAEDREAFDPHAESWGQVKISKTHPVNPEPKQIAA